MIQNSTSSRSFIFLAFLFSNQTTIVYFLLTSKSISVKFFFSLMIKSTLVNKSPKQLFFFFYDVFVFKNNKKNSAQSPKIYFHIILTKNLQINGNTHFYVKTSTKSYYQEISILCLTLNYIIQKKNQEVKL